MEITSRRLSASASAALAGTTPLRAGFDQEFLCNAEFG
jgi:hypothetical protein